MIDETTHRDRDLLPGVGRSPVQFSLGRLLVVMAGGSLVFAVVAWDGEALSRAPEAFMVIGLCLLAVAMYRRSVFVLLLSMIVLLRVLVGVDSFAKRPEFRQDVIHWGIAFQLVDKRTGTPIAGAVVRLATPVGTEKATTDSQGRVTIGADFRKRFRSKGEGDYGPNFRECEVEIVAEGHAQARFPLGQLLPGVVPERRAVIKIP